MSQDDVIKDLAASHKPEEKKENTADVLARIASTGPIWLRALALIALLATTITPYWEKVSGWIDDYQMNKILQTTVSISDPSGGTPYTPDKGQKIAAPLDAHKLALNSLSPEDSIELTRHIAVLQEPLNFKRLLVNQKKGAIAYSIFPSDGCILINHTSRSVKLDLVRAEELPLKLQATPPQQSERPAHPASALGYFGTIRKPHGLKAVLSSDDINWDRQELKSKIDWALQDRSIVDNSEKSPVQGSCLNPHPGPFRYWSQPVAQCMEQVWRQFPDNCTHYQFHNFCSNVWDPAVHWTFCAMH